MTKNSHAIFILLSLLLVVSLEGKSEGATWEQNRWNNTVYYRNTFSAEIDWEALLHVAAVDSYEVYFNGTLVGADSVSTRMQGYAITVVEGNNKNHIGVKVANRGRGEGNGLLAAVVVAVEDTTFAQVDSFLVTSTTDRSQHTWFWTALGDNYPNPFNPETTIRIAIPNLGDPVRTTITVYNMTGQEIVRLVDEEMQAGAYEVTWDGRDAQGSSVASGVYMYRMEVGDLFSESKMMTFVK